MAKNWEETVMTPQDMLDVMYSIPAREPGEDYSRLNEAMCKAQAKISDEARDGEIEAALQQGRREVVEWVRNNHGDLGTIEQPILTINGRKWKAKLKDWGIEKEKGEDDG